jgi:hypothetical protein
VELVLDPNRIPGFIPGKKRRVPWGQVTQPQPGTTEEDEASASLSAEDVSLSEGKGKSLVTIRADGYDRAFLFDTTFARASTPDKGTLIGSVLRINAAPMADPSKPVHVRLEADNIPETENGRLVLDLETRGKDGVKPKFNRLAEFPGDRNKRLFYVAGSHKGLLFEPKVEDWSTNLNLNGLHGKITLRLKYLDGQNHAIKVLDTETAGWKTDVSEVRKSIILDDASPEDVRFEKMPRVAVRGKALPVSASATAGPSGIHEVVFFLGKELPDGKLPPEAVTIPGDRLTKDGKIWTAELKVPRDQKSPANVSVRFTNGVGLSSTAVVAVDLMDPPAEVKVVKKGSIAGSVMEGDRPQAGLKVDLLNAAGKVLASVTTKEDGTFAFKDLDAGAYQVSSAKASSDTKGLSEVKLADKENKTGIVIKLWR